MLFVIYFSRFLARIRIIYGIRVRAQTKNRAKVRLFFYMTK